MDKHNRDFESVWRTVSTHIYHCKRLGVGEITYEQTIILRLLELWQLVDNRIQTYLEQDTTIVVAAPKAQVDLAYALAEHISKHFQGSEEMFLAQYDIGYVATQLACMSTNRYFTSTRSDLTESAYQLLTTCFPAR